MSVEENKEVVRRLIEEVWNQGKADVIDELIAPDFVHHGSGIRGREGHRKLLADVKAILPDVHETVEHIIGEGDLVANRCLCTGTPRSEWLGLPPTGKQVKWSITVLNRIVDGMVAEIWDDWSALGVYQQLGGILTKGEN